MALYNYQAASFNLNDVVTAIGPALSQQEQQLNMQLNQLQSNPSPDPASLAIFQANLSTWTNLVQMESSIVKDYGDTTKQVVTNIGS